MLAVKYYAFKNYCANFEFGRDGYGVVGRNVNPCGGNYTLLDSVQFNPCRYPCHAFASPFGSTSIDEEFSTCTVVVDCMGWTQLCMPVHCTFFLCTYVVDDHVLYTYMYSGIAGSLYSVWYYWKLYFCYYTMYLQCATMLQAHCFHTALEFNINFVSLIGSSGFNKIATEAQEIRKRNFTFRDYYK